MRVPRHPYIRVVLRIHLTARAANNEAMSQEHDRDRAVLLSIAAFAAMIIAYLLGLTVLGDTDMASKFENGVAPAGTDIGGLRIAAAGSVFAALGAWVAAITSRRVIPVLLILLISVPFVLMSLVTLQLAF